MSINYLDILKKSWSVTWKHKHLWWFGLFIALGSGGGSLSYNRDSTTDGQAKIVGEQILNFVQQHLTLIIVSVLALIIIFIVLTILGIIGRGALIHSAHAITKGETTTFRSGFATGKKYFWQIFGIGFVLAILTFIIMFIVIIPIIFLFISKSYILGTILAIAGIALLIPLIILATFLKKFGCLYAILGNLKIRPALENAYALFLKNLSTSIIMALIFIPISIALALAVLFILFPVAVIFLVIGGILYLIFNKIGVAIAIGLAAICCLIIFLAARSIYETFAQTVWVLFFHEIAKPKVEEKVTEAAKEKMPDPIATPDPVTFSENNFLS